MQNIMNGTRSTLKQQICEIIMNSDKPMTALEVSNFANIPKNGTAHSMLGQMYSCGLLGRRVGDSGLLEYFSTPQTKNWQDIPIGKEKKKPAKKLKQKPAEPKKNSNVILEINGIRMTMEEALEFYIQLQQVFK